MRIKTRRKWPFYGASVFIHLVLIWVLSLMPQGFGASPFTRAGRGEGVYRVKYLGSPGTVAEPSSPVSPKKGRGKVVFSSLRHARGKPKSGKGLEGERAVKKTVAARKMAKVAARDLGKKDRSGNRERVSSLRKTPGRDMVDPSLLTGPGYGEEAVLAAMASGPGEGEGDPGSGGDRGKGKGGIVPPLPLAKEKPPYPPLARRRGYHGRLLIKLLVSPLGKVDRVVLVKSSGYSILDRVAVKTLKKWRFRPAMKNGRPISFWVEVPVVFDLREGRG